MALSIAAKARLQEHFNQTAKAFGVEANIMVVGNHYAATPTAAQTIYQKIIEDGNAFLASINILPVSEMTGQKIGMSLSGRVASRTDTSNPANERTPKHLSNLDTTGYSLAPTEFDVALSYAKIDSWAKFPNFASLYMALVRLAIGNDMLQIGWTGASVATGTNIGTNPLLQDVNKGWLQLIREFNGGSQYLLGATGSVTLGSATFKNLDVLAKAAKDMLPVHLRNRDDLVLMVGNDVMSYQEDVYLELNGNTPTEKAMLSGRITKAYAGMPTITPAFFPDSTILVTPLKNLSIYYQDTSVRRLQKDKPERNEVQDFNSANHGYVVEDELLTALIEGIEFA
tara:strand:+ start:84803 stop:85825 length:1023 start_codon:yes stop_codon:yes gene_type:complete